MAPVDAAVDPAAPYESNLDRLVRRAGWFLRDRFPNRWVEREVGGVRMAMPWSHRLPDYMRLDPAYGANLLELAATLSAGEEIAMIDVGANIGDSTLLLLDRVPGKVLAVEPDEVFLPFLRHNARGRSEIEIEPSVLVADDTTTGVFSTARIGGTATLQQTGNGSALPTISVTELRRRHPDFARVRLVKSDTDGYDVTLVPAIASAWSDARPVLFFEYDHHASHAAGNDPMTVWDALAALGYAECAVWDNGGHPLFRAPLDAARARAGAEQPSSPVFWDVAAVHADDVPGIAAIDRLAPVD